MRRFTKATLAALLIAGTLAGCAATNSGPVAGFDGSWTISQRGVIAAQAQTLTQAATEEAKAHCAAQGKRFRQIDLKESSPGLLAPRAESTLNFACD